MSVTPQLLRLFRVDQQIYGLKSRLRAAERFLAEQTRQVEELQSKVKSLQAQSRQLAASASNSENEANAIQQRMDVTRDRMNSAQTNKEYQALLIEMNTHKADKSVHDEAAIESLTQIDKIKSELDTLGARLAEREGMLKVALQQRDERKAEIKDRLEELEQQRVNLVGIVPGDTVARYLDRTEKFGEDEDGVMVAVQAHDFKRQEFVCGSCMMGIPFEKVMQLLKERETNCSACGVFLFIEQEMAERLVAKVK